MNLSQFDNVAKQGVKAGAKETDMSRAAKALEASLSPPVPKAPAPVAAPKHLGPVAASKPKQKKQPHPLGPVAQPRSRFNNTAYEVMINQMLGGSTTQIGNFVGGLANSITGPAKTAVKSVISAGRKGPDKTHASEVAYGVFGMFDGFQRFMQYSGKRLANNIPGQGKELASETAKKVGLNPDLAVSSKLDTQNRAWTAERFNLKPESFIGHLVTGLGSMVNSPGTMLNYVDLGMKSLTNGRVEWEQARRLVKTGEETDFTKAIERVRTDPELKKKAVNEAEEFTYTNDPQSAVRWILSKEVDLIPGLRYVVPFRRTLANIFEQGLSHSPLVLASPVLRKNLFSKNAATADAARAKLIFGTTLVTTLGYTLKDNLVGEAPREPSANRIFNEIHGGENIVKFDNVPGIGTLKIPTKYLDIYGPLLNVVARLNQLASNIREPQLTEEGITEVDASYAEIMMTTFDALFSGHWASNVVDFSAKITQSIQSGDPKPMLQFMERTLGHSIIGVGHNGVIELQQRGYPLRTKKEKPGDTIMSWTTPGAKKQEVIYLHNGEPALLSKFAGNEEIRKEWQTDVPHADVYEELDVQWAAVPERITVDSTNTQGAIEPAVLKVGPEDRKAIAKIMREGHGGFPSVNEYMEQRVFQTKVFYGDIVGAHPAYQKNYIETVYRSYVDNVVPLAKGDMSPGALGDRIRRLNEAQANYITSLNQRKNQ